MKEISSLTTRFTRAVLMCALSLFPLSAFALEKVACHVVVETGEHLVKFVETGSLQEAAEASLITESYDSRGAKVQVMEVVECIHYPNGRFSDKEMQSHMEQMPL